MPLLNFQYLNFESEQFQINLLNSKWIFSLYFGESDLLTNIKDI